MQKIHFLSEDCSDLLSIFLTLCHISILLSQYYDHVTLLSFKFRMGLNVSIIRILIFLNLLQIIAYFYSYLLSKSMTGIFYEVFIRQDHIFFSFFNFIPAVLPIFSNAI